MLVTTDDGLKSYLGQVLSQLSEWLMQRSVQKLVLVVSGVDSGEVLERWVFDVEADGETTDAE
jgi:mitotic spindle assembly checkpoint protein MAD2